MSHINFIVESNMCYYDTIYYNEVHFYPFFKATLYMVITGHLYNMVITGNLTGKYIYCVFRVLLNPNLMRIAVGVVALLPFEVIIYSNTILIG